MSVRIPVFIITMIPRFPKSPISRRIKKSLLIDESVQQENCRKEGSCFLLPQLPSFYSLYGFFSLSSRSFILAAASISAQYLICFSYSSLSSMTDRTNPPGLLYLPSFKRGSIFIRTCSIQRSPYSCISLSGT